MVEYIFHIGYMLYFPAYFPHDRYIISYANVDTILTTVFCRYIYASTLYITFSQYKLGVKVGM